MCHSKTMKRAISLLALLGFSVFITACTSWEATAYKTLKATDLTVQGGRTGWTNYVGVMRTSLDPNTKERYDLEIQVKKIGEVYAKYQAAMRVCQAAIAQYKLDEKTQPAAQAALNALGAASGELTALITSFLTK